MVTQEDVFTYSFDVRDDIRPLLKHDHILRKREVVKVLRALFI